MRIALDTAHDARMAAVANALQESARAHKQAIKAHRRGLSICMDALAVVAQITQGEAEEQHGPQRSERDCA